MLYTQFANAKYGAVFIMYENPNEGVLYCVAPRGWEFAESCWPKNYGILNDMSLTSILIDLGQELQDTTITDFTYSPVELKVVCEKEGYGYDVFVCSGYGGSFLEVNGKPRVGGRLLKNLLYYMMYKHLTSGQPGEFSDEMVADIKERYAEWSIMKPQDLPSVIDIFQFNPSWIPQPIPLPDSTYVEGVYNEIRE